MFHSIAPLLWHNCAATDIRRAVIRPSFCSDTCGIAKTYSLVHIHPCSSVYTLPSFCSVQYSSHYIYITKNWLYHQLQNKRWSIMKSHIRLCFNRQFRLHSIVFWFCYRYLIKTIRKPIRFSLKNFPKEFPIGGECFFSLFRAMCLDQDVHKKSV